MRLKATDVILFFTKATSPECILHPWRTWLWQLVAQAPSRRSGVQPNLLVSSLGSRVSQCTGLPRLLRSFKVQASKSFQAKKKIQKAYCSILFRSYGSSHFLHFSATSVSAIFDSRFLNMFVFQSHCKSKLRQPSVTNALAILILFCTLVVSCHLFDAIAVWRAFLVHCDSIFGPRLLGSTRAHSQTSVWECSTIPGFAPMSGLSTSFLPNFGFPACKIGTSLDPICRLTSWLAWTCGRHKTTPRTNDM